MIFPKGWAFWIVIAASVVLAFLLALCSVKVQPAHAHDAAQWIQDGGYKNSAGELCCGKRDCDELEDSQVKITPLGYEVTLRTAPSPIDGMRGYIHETVPFSEATPSPDGRYWRCQWGGSRKCFFAPPNAM